MSETQFIKGDKVRNFTTIDNSCLQDKELTWAAKGFHTYLMTLPGNWKIIKADLINRSRDKLCALNTIIAELEAAGYLVIEEQKRESNGRFGSKCYKVYEHSVKKTKKGRRNSSSKSNAKTSGKEVKAKKSHRSGFSATVEPRTDEPTSNNDALTNTYLPNTYILKTELTNSREQAENIPTEQAVNEQELESESSFTSIITKLLDGQENTFDSNFEDDVIKILEKSKIDLCNLEAYLKYVYSRTSKSNVHTSFCGYYRKLALSGSIVSDFKNGCLKKTSKTEKQPVVQFISCPICSSQIQKDGSGCPNCNTDMRIIRNPNLPDFTVQQKLWKMSDNEKAAYEKALSDFKAKLNRPFISESEYIQFWTEYGFIK